jgi:hypothetical protein
LKTGYSLPPVELVEKRSPEYSIHGNNDGNRIVCDGAGIKYKLMDVMVYFKLAKN